MDVVISKVGEERPGRTTLWVIALATFACLCAISGQSFWIDETLTAWKAATPTLRDWWRGMESERASDLQMPLYMLVMWGWEKVFGHGEWALRLANAPWFVMGLAVFHRTFARAGGWGPSLVVLFSAFAWYYLGEARPYAMQVGTSLMIVAALWRLRGTTDARTERQWVWILCAGVVALSGSSMLAMIFCGAFLAASILAAGWTRVWQLVRSHWGCWLTMLLICLGLGLYYLWTLKHGARGTSAGKTDLRNILFVFYELFGFSGLGPGRLELRSGGLSAVPAHLPLLVPYAVLVLLVLVMGWRRMVASVSRKTLLSWALIVGGATLFLFAVGFRSQFRVLGRHFTPLLPLVCLILGFGVSTLIERRGWRRCVAILFLALSIVSAAGGRLASRHAKDAYREAAAVANAALARGESVWWNAEPRGAEVYHLPVSGNAAEPGTAWLVINPNKGFATALSPPDWLVASKPDLYDAGIAEFTSRSGYRKELVLPAFVIWRKHPK